MVSQVVCKASQLIFLGTVFVVGVSSNEGRVLVRQSRQSHGKNAQHDQSSAETGFLGGGGVENSKYFQEIYVLRPDPKEIEFGHVFETPQEWEQRYEKKDFNRNRHQGKHLPEHDKYEFGHRRGNDHHVIERYEKAIPHEGQFKTKVRWADKKGGHGEHYWDYNHAGHGGNGGQGDGDGGYSDPVPVYSGLQKPTKQHHKRQLKNEEQAALEDVETQQNSQPVQQSDADDKRDFVKKIEKEIGRVENYDIQKEAGKQEKAPKERTVPSEDSRLLFDVKSGKVVDELTGKKYILQPVN